MLFDMNRRAMLSAFAAFTAFPALSALAQTPAADPLPSWNDTATAGPPRRDEVRGIIPSLIGATHGK